MNHTARIALALLCVLCCGSRDMPAATATDNEAIKSFFGKYCMRCHNEMNHEGEFRLDNLSRDFRDKRVAQDWAELLFRLNAGEMPPADQPQPASRTLGEVAEWISLRIAEGRAARMARRGPVSHYRLSRDEYANVVYDLLGVHFDVRMPGALNEDPRWHGFSRIGSMLSLSPSHVTRYLTAADSVLHAAFPTRPPKTVKHRQDAGTPNRWLILPGHRQGNINVRDAGLYRIRIQLSAVASFKGRLPRLSIWNNSLKRAEAGRDVIAPEDEPTIVEIETFLPKGGFQLTNQAPGKLDDGHTLTATPRLVTRLADYQTIPKGYKLFTDDAAGEPIFPLLLVDWLEFEGPILTDADKRKREGMFPVDAGASRESLRTLMSRAWRRPPTDQEVDRYMHVLESELSAGEKHRDAFLSAAAGVLASKNFYYIVEGQIPVAPETAENPDIVNDWQLASRLSFLLWNSMPDAELLALAGAGKLKQPTVLKAQFQRMIGDGKADRFLQSFPKQWLQLHRVGMFPPDPEMYPDYDRWLEQSMIRETTAYFAEVFRENLSIREFLSSDWTMMNSRLALHYGIDIPSQSGFRRIALDDSQHRGGILTHASVLSLTSDGTRHRPVHRGVWVSEAIFARTPPPPPPNVEPLEPTPSNKPKATIRDQLEAHATHSICASCHRKIDPLGFAFDNYDAIGRWRTNETVIGGEGEDPVVDSSGVLADGRRFQNAKEFKQLLEADIDRFAEAFVEQLATYALRRVVTIDDQQQIRMIAERSKASDYRLRTMIENLVLSELYQHR